MTTTAARWAAVCHILKEGEEASGMRTVVLRGDAMKSWEADALRESMAMVVVVVGEWTVHTTRLRLKRCHGPGATLGRAVTSMCG